MSEGVSVGVISLDLVIKNKIEGQINKIKTEIHNSFSKPMEEAGKTAEQAVEKAVESSKKAIDEGFGIASEIAKESQKKAVEACMAEYDKLQNKINQVTSNSSAPETVKVVKVKYDPEYDLSKVNAEVEKLTQEMQSKIKSSTQKVKQTVTETAETARSEAVQSVNVMDERIGTFAISAGKKFSSVAQSIRSGLGSAVSYTSNTVRKTLGGSFNFLKKTGGKALNSIKAKFNSVGKSIAGTSKPLSKFTHSLKSAAKRVFLMAGVYAAFRGIKSAVTEMCESNDEFSKSLNEIKANLNIAFTPIMNTVMPYLNALMSGVAAATKTLAAFISELFGTTYAKSLEATKKAKNAQKEVEKAQKSYLASFDEMNVAGNEDSDSSNDNSSVDYSAIDSNVQLPDWAEKLKDSIRQGDWASVGALAAEKINETFAYINWDGVQTKLNKFVDGITSGLNSFIDTVDWTGLGDSFGGGINTIFGAGYRFMKKFNWAGFGKGTAKFLNSAIKKTDWTLVGKTFASKWSAIIDYLYSFVTTFDWSGFGSSLGDSVNGWFEEIDWAKAGKTISQGIKGLLDTAINFLKTVDWQGVGEKVWTFLKSIDWGGISSKLFEAIGAALGSAVSLRWGVIKDIVKQIQDHFSESFDKFDTGSIGLNIILGLLDGIWQAIKDIGTWIYDHIFKPFMDGFKECFGIHSPSTVMAEMGDYIIQGLYNAIESGIEKIKEIFGKVLDTIKGIFKDIGTWFQEKFQGAWDNVKSVFSGVKLFFSNRWDDIKEAFANVKTWFKEKFQGAWDGVKDVFSDVGEFFNGIWDGITSGFKGFINGIIDGINWLIREINDISISAPDWDWLPDNIQGKSWGFNIPEIPHLATGGLATAPTLAMVGDNKNAKSDPEVISPLSKLQGMLDNGKIDEIIILLEQIIELLKNLNLTATVDDNVLFRLLVEANKRYKRKTGVSAF